MPDLDAVAVTGWLHAREPVASATLAVVAPVDTDPDALAVLLRVGRALDSAATDDPAALSGRLRRPPAQERLRTALAQIGAARRLRLLNWFAETGIPDRDALLAELGGGHEGVALRAELLALHRQALLARIFAPERVAALLAACRQAGAGRSA